MLQLSRIRWSFPGQYAELASGFQYAEFEPELSTLVASMVVVASLVAGSAAFVPKSESQALLDPSAKYPGECPCNDSKMRGLFLFSL